MARSDDNGCVGNRLYATYNRYFFTKLIEHGANTNAYNVYGYTPVHFAALNGLYGYLVIMNNNNKTDMTIPNRQDYNKTPIHYACSNGHEQAIIFLEKFGNGVNMLDGYGRTLVHFAAQNGHHKCLSVLSEIGAVMSRGDKSNSTPMHLAGSNGYAKCIKILIRRGASINQVNNRNGTPLHCIIDSIHDTLSGQHDRLSSYIRCITQLLLNHCDLSIRNSRGETPVEVAINTQKYTVLKCFVENGVNIEPNENFIPEFNGWLYSMKQDRLINMFIGPDFRFI